MPSNTDPTASKKEDAGSVLKKSKAMELFPAVEQDILCETGKLFKLIFMVLVTTVQYLLSQCSGSDPSDETLAQPSEGSQGWNLISKFWMLSI